MSGAKRILKANLKEDLKNLGGAIIGSLIGVTFLILFLSQTIMKDEGISFGEFLNIAIIIMLLFSIAIVIALDQAQSVGDIYPMASKLGNKRTDIALGLFLKDIVLLASSGLLMYILTNLLLSEARADIVEVFRKSLNPIFITNFILGISSISLIASSIAYILRVNPIVGSLFGLVFAFAIFLKADVMALLELSNIWMVAILFIIGQVLRYLVITKLDARF